MARREYCYARQHFKFPFRSRSQVGEAPAPELQLNSPLSPVDVITRSVQTMKRFFATTTSKDTVFEEKPLKRARVDNNSALLESCDLHTISESTLRNSDDNFYVPPERTKRNGMVFEDITLWSHNMPKSKTLPNRKPTVSLADIDFTKPPPEWMNLTFMQTAPEAQTLTQVPDQYVSTNSTRHPEPVLVDFLPLQEYNMTKDTVTSSLSALPPQPGYLQETLFNHVMNSLSTLVSRADDGLRGVWESALVTPPPHFIDAIVFVTAACKSLAKVITAEDPAIGETTDLGSRFVETVMLVVRVARVIDVMDLLHLIKDSTHVKCTARLSRTLDILIAASNRFVVDVESTLQMLAESLDASIPIMLFPSRFRIHQALFEYHLNASIYHLVNESVVLKWSLEKLDHLHPILKRIGRQLDRIVAEENLSHDGHRQVLSNLNLKRDMLQAFFDGISTNGSKSSFMAFRTASELADTAKEHHVEAECLYRMATILVKRGKLYAGTTPNDLLISARSLNSSHVFQSKVQPLLTSLRRRTISSILDIAATVHQEYDIAGYNEKVRLFVHVLLEKYPAEGVDPNTILKGDIVKGILKVIRVFHPDKNSCADEETRWIYEEITKVRSHYAFAE